MDFEETTTFRDKFSNPEQLEYFVIDTGEDVRGMNRRCGLK